MKTLLLVLCSALLVTAQPFGSSTKGNLTVVVTVFRPEPPPGQTFSAMPGSQPGIMVSVATSDPTTEAFKITVTFQVDSAPFTQTQIIQRVRGQIPFATVGFILDPSSYKSLLIEELKPTASQEFN